MARPPLPRPRACGHHGGGRACGASPARLYMPGWRCAAHTPAALAGRPEPGAGRYCPPRACYCGQCGPPPEALAALEALSAPQSAAPAQSPAPAPVSASWAVLGRRVAVSGGTLTVDGRPVAGGVDPADVIVYGRRLCVAGRPVADLAADLEVTA